MRTGVSHLVSLLVGAGLAMAVPATGLIGNCPNPKHDCFTVGGPGCSDPKCCEIVCSFDPSCCEVAWDAICVGHSVSGLCEFLGPRNDNCADGIQIGEVCVLGYTTIGATSDGPAHILCENGTVDQMVNQDIWYNYTACCEGDVTISLCGSGYDTKLAVYEGCTCELSDANLIDCTDDTCALQSKITFPGTAGQCYKIRVGGYLGAVGNGDLTIINSGVSRNPCPHDFDHNGVINVDDLLVVINGWGPCP